MAHVLGSLRAPGIPGEWEALVLKAPFQGSPPQHPGVPSSGASPVQQRPHPAVCPAGKAESEPKNRLAPRPVKPPGQSAVDTG